MVKINKTMCFDAEVIDFMKKKGNMSAYLNDLVRTQMQAYPDIPTISFEMKRFQCSRCRVMIKTDEKTPFCAKCRQYMELV